MLGDRRVFEASELTNWQVFANSNSLPISLVISLSQTIRGLHWNKIPGDSDNEVGARGILYLLIFQQLGQFLRWSWGINVLLPRTAEDSPQDDHSVSRMERGKGQDFDQLEDEPNDDRANQHDTTTIEHEYRESAASQRLMEDASPIRTHSDQDREWATWTPAKSQQNYSSISKASSTHGFPHSGSSETLLATPVNGNLLPTNSNGRLKCFPSTDTARASNVDSCADHPRTFVAHFMHLSKLGFHSISKIISQLFKSIFDQLPSSIKNALAKLVSWIRLFFYAIWQSLNPPLIAMAVALIVASIPALQRLFFSDGTFVKNSVTSAIRQSGAVAVPLILVVLGANLAGTSSVDDSETPRSDEAKFETRLVVASLISRMVLPTFIMAPLLAVTAKYIPISIVGDPIFVIVCFLLAGAPSALQLAQICQLNNVYMGAMTRILFHSYVIW